MVLSTEAVSGCGRALDHYIVQVRDLDRAGATYERLGFYVLPRMKHLDVGTSNRVIQLQSTYLELFGDFDKAPAAMVSQYEPRFACGEGLVHVSFRSYALEADREAAREAGLAPGDIISARREVIMPDGSVEETASRCFYMWRSEHRYLSLFLSDHGKPEVIWVPAYQQHANTAIETIGITYVSDDPQRDKDYFSRQYGTPPALDTGESVSFIGANGDVAEILSRTAIQDRYPAIDLKTCNKLPAYPLGLEFSVASLDACRTVLQDNGVRFVAADHTVVVPPENAHGVVIEFTEEP